MRRVQDIFHRYGIRAIFVVFALSSLRYMQLRSALLSSWLKLVTLGYKGKAIIWGRSVFVKPGGHFDCGNAVYIGDRCVIEIGVTPKAHLFIGENTWISHDCHIACSQEIKIGEKVLVGEFVSIRDSSHTYADLGKPIKDQPDSLGKIVIEDGVWIGRGCLILGRPEGIFIGSGAVIAANSVVSRSIPSMQVWGGVPVRFIKSR